MISRSVGECPKALRLAHDRLWITGMGMLRFIQNPVLPTCTGRLRVSGARVTRRLRRCSNMSEPWRSCRPSSTRSNTWAPRFEGPSRADRLGGWYHPFVPDLLVGWDPLIPGSVAASVGRAEAAVRALNRSGVHAGLAGVSRFLLRAESVGSSAIEGLRVGPRRVLAAEEQIARGAVVGDSVAAEVVGNIDAMRRAVAVAAQPGPLTLDGLLEVHRLLMDRSPTPELGVCCGKSRVG